MPFEFKPMDIEDVILVTPRVFNDERGFFLESYKSSDFIANGISCEFLQDNHSLSAKGVVRGLHFQKPPESQAKLVRVVKGAVYDVAVDIREDSETYLKWVGAELSDTNHSMLYIPEGFAHGFAALSDEVHLMYKCSNEYSPECEAGIRWDDPQIGIKWPVENAIVSEKDRVLPFLSSLNLQSAP